MRARTVRRIAPPATDTVQLVSDREPSTVLLVTGRADIGGGPEHVMRLIDDMPDRFELAVAAPDEQPYFDRYAAAAVVAAPLASRKNLPANWWRLFRQARRVAPDVIHSHGKAAGLISRPVGALLRTPVIHTFHGVHIDQYRTIVRSAYLLLERLLLRATQTVIAVSASEGAQIDELVTRGRRPVRVIPNGVSPPTDLDEIDYDGRLRLIAVARLTYQKHPERLLDAAEMLRSLDPDACLRIVGAGELEAALRAEIERRSLGDVVELRGERSPIWSELTWANAYLSTARWEGMPIAVLEAMATGLAVVLPRIGGHVELVDHETDGLLWEPDGDDELRLALGAVLDPSTRRRLGTAARDKVRCRYGSAATASAVAEIYDETISADRPR
jgi:glycosyltransferase involved in cell wall biosynthesis